MRRKQRPAAPSAGQGGNLAAGGESLGIPFWLGECDGQGGDWKQNRFLRISRILHLSSNHCPYHKYLDTICYHIEPDPGVASILLFKLH